MANIFKLPDVGEGMAEGEIAEWLVKVGDVVEEGQPIVEIQNDKLLQEVLSPYSGTVTKIFVETGTISKVGDPLIEFDGDGSGAGAGEETPAAAEATTQAAPAEQPAATPKESPASAPQPASANTGSGRPLAMPSVRRFAFENDIDIAAILGTGKHGQITKSDVLAVISGDAPTSATTRATTAQGNTDTSNVSEGRPDTSFMSIQGDSEVREPLSGMRKAISKAMVTSKHTAPHVTLFDEVEVSKLVKHRATFKTVAAEQDIKLTYLPYIVKALIAVVKKYPALNASLDDEAQEVIFKNYYNIGIATDTKQGLYVPNIKNADRKSIFDIASEITYLAGEAHSGALKMADMKSGTITISNIGSAGGAWFTPIINYPEVAILGIGRIEKQPVIDENDELVIGNILKISLSFDHRLIDGMTAQNAVNELKRLLKDPERLLMEV